MRLDQQGEKRRKRPVVVAKPKGDGHQWPRVFLYITHFYTTIGTPSSNGLDRMLASLYTKKCNVNVMF